MHLYTLHGDVLELHQILGLKQSFSPFVDKNCHLREESKSNYKALMCKLRLPQEHSERMNIIENLFENDKIQWKEKSQQWGINHKSPLADIYYFLLY